MGGIKFNPQGQMTGVTWMGGGIGQLSVQTALLLILAADALPGDIEDGLMMLSELHRTDQLSARQLAQIKRALGAHRPVFLSQHRKTCWLNKRPPEAHFWWFDQDDWI